VVEETEPIANVGGAANGHHTAPNGASVNAGSAANGSSNNCHPSTDARIRLLEAERDKAQHENLQARMLYKAAEARIADLQTTRAANGQSHISMRFNEPDRRWVTDMQAAQQRMMEKLADVGSELKPEALKTPASALTVDPSLPNNLLRPEQLFYRFKPLIDAPAQLAELGRKIAALKDPAAAGDRVVALNEINETLHLSGQRMCIIICGHESAGKTSMIECIIGRRIGYSAAGRATCCPVIYFFEKKVGSNVYHMGGSAQEMGGAPARPIDQLPDAVKNHMEAIKLTPRGVSEKPLYVKVVSEDIVYSGVVVDCPGTLIQPDGADPSKRQSEKDFLEDVKMIIGQQLALADPDNSVILCMELRQHVQNAGGCGAFYNSILSKVPDFDKYAKRVKIVCNKNDFGYRDEKGNKEWLVKGFTLDDRDQVELTYNEVINNIIKDGQYKPHIYFTCMKGLDKLYKAADADPQIKAQLGTLREEMLKSTADELVKAFKPAFPSKVKVMNPDHSFYVSNLRRDVLSQVEKSVLSATDRTLADINRFLDRLQAALAAIGDSAEADSKSTNSALVRAAFREFIKQIKIIAQEGMPSSLCLPPVSLHFDMDDRCKQIHAKFPQLLNYYEFWPKHTRPENPSQTLQRCLQIHKAELSHLPPEELEKQCLSLVDAFEQATINLVGAYERMINSLIVRLFSVQLKYVHPSMFYQKLNQGVFQRSPINDPVQAARAVAVMIAEAFYSQFFGYFRDVVTHFFHEAVELALLYMRIPQHEEQPCYVASYEVPFATFRHLLREAVSDWVKNEVDVFRESIVNMVSAADLRPCAPLGLCHRREHHQGRRYG